MKGKGQGVMICHISYVVVIWLLRVPPPPRFANLRLPTVSCLLPMDTSFSPTLLLPNTSFELLPPPPPQAVSWYAVGCYYMATRQFDQARRFFGKATALEPSFAPAWLGYGHAFAAQDERDQVRGVWGGGGGSDMRLQAIHQP